MPPKQTSPESAQSRAFIRYKMRWEGYFNTATDEFLEEFERQLQQHGLRPEELVYRGFDGDLVARGKRPRMMMIYAMNEPGWREAIRQHEPTPAEYAQGFDNPCIALFDKFQLSDVYAGDTNVEQELLLEQTVEEQAEIEHDLVEGRIRPAMVAPEDEAVLNELRPTEALRDLDNTTPVRESMVHVDYPRRPATDALVGLVFIEH